MIALHYGGAITSRQCPLGLSADAQRDISQAPGIAEDGFGLVILYGLEFANFLTIQLHATLCSAKAH